jgi:hypothetical protein
MPNNDLICRALFRGKRKFFCVLKSYRTTFWVSWIQSPCSHTIPLLCHLSLCLPKFSPPFVTCAFRACYMITHLVRVDAYNSWRSSSCLNYWVMHPVARVSINYWKNLRMQPSIFSARFYCALLTLHVSAPFSGHLQVVRKHKLIMYFSLTSYHCLLLRIKYACWYTRVRNAYNVSVQISKSRTPLGRPTRKWIFIFKRILKKHDRSVLTALIRFGIGSNGVFF